MVRISIHHHTNINSVVRTTDLQIIKQRNFLLTSTTSTTRISGVIYYTYQRKMTFGVGQPPKGLNGENSIGRKQLKMYRQQSSYRFDEWRPWLTGAWILHFVICSLMVVWGCLQNIDGRKYVPIQISNNNIITANISDEMTQRSESSDLSDNKCYKGFVNVFADSIDDPGAVVYCCQNNNFLPSDSPVGAGICQSPHWFVWLSQRLARFPEAWLLPLFPILLRFVVVTLFHSNGNKRIKPSDSDAGASSSSSSSSGYPSTSIQQRLLRRRFYLYLFLIQIRGWVLYLLLDRLEDRWMTSSSSSSSTNQCWYQPLIPNHYGSCHGQASDFSDHMVLYCAQILPLALTEMLHSIAVPYWNDIRGNSSSSRNRIIIPVILVTGVLYLYVLTCAGIMKTATFFHTWQEVVCGYLISMVIQVPLFLMQTNSMTYLERPREYFFGLAMS
jgi:hypothetical protein